MANRKEQDLGAVERSAQSASRELHAIEAELDNADGQLQRSQRSLDGTLVALTRKSSVMAATERRKRIADATEGQPLDKLLKEAHEEIDARRKYVPQRPFVAELIAACSTLETLQYTQRFFTRLLEHGKQSNCCTACQRSFTKGPESAKFETYVR
jgi:hypothetical protein